ncbi:phage integrase N-terminal SAM-like domain-containing protein [Billgrantia desiderata]|uniref:phage integrase N-terminal SAM-like domain-containing protein n=1 Tax=Billgrantia desiderata TaxID=52021 RepID=UPI0030F40BF9
MYIHATKGPPYGCAQQATEADGPGEGYHAGKRYSPRTEKTYCYWICYFIRFHGMHSPLG